MSDQIDRTVLPIRRPPFQGVANRTLGSSEPDWDFVAPIPAPDGAPNVLLVMTDDAGFGNPSTFGGPIRTPTLDRLADGGLKTFDQRFRPAAGQGVRLDRPDLEDAHVAA